MPDPCIDLLARLVAIDSVNPSLVAGRSRRGAQSPPRSPSTCATLGLDVHVQEVAPGRPNVIGVLDSGVAGTVADVLRSHRYRRRRRHGGAVRAGRSATAASTDAARRT